MGLHRREMALGSSVRRTRGPSGVPGTAPAGSATVFSQTWNEVVNTTFNTTGKTILSFEVIGTGGTAGGGIGGGGGGYAKMTASLPSPMPSQVFVRISTGGGGVSSVLDDDTFELDGTNGQDGADGGGQGFGGGGDINHNGGNGGAAGGGRAASATADGADNSPGGTSDGDGGDPPAGAGKLGRVTITWH